jgi:hypothetical protein
MSKQILPGVEVYENVLNGHFITFLSEKMSEYWQVKEKIVDGEVKRRSSYVQLSEVLDDARAKAFYDFFLEELKLVIEEYKTKYAIPNMIPEYHEGTPVVTLLKYEVGDEIHYHSDSVGEDNRIAVAIGYFNDDYSGGSLDFQFFDQSINPDAGSLVLSPANYPYSHRSSVVESGTKYAVRCFLVSR